MRFSDITNSNITVSNGATLSLPGVTTYQGGGSTLDHTSTLQATGAGSLLSLPHLATVATSMTFGDSTTELQAIGNGQVASPVLTQISGNTTQLSSEGSGSLLSVPLLSSFSSQSTISGITANAGTVSDPSLTTFDHVNLAPGSSRAVKARARSHALPTAR